MKELSESLPRGSSALFVLVRRATYDRLLEELAPFHGRIIRTSLSREQERQLVELVAQHSAMRPGVGPRPAPAHQPAPSA